MVLNQLVAAIADINLPEIYLVNNTHRDEVMYLAIGILSKLRYNTNLDMKRIFHILFIIYQLTRFRYYITSITSIYLQYLVLLHGSQASMGWGQKNLLCQTAFEIYIITNTEINIFPVRH